MTNSFLKMKNKVKIKLLITDQKRVLLVRSTSLPDMENFGEYYSIPSFKASLDEVANFRIWVMNNLGVVLDSWKEVHSQNSYKVFVGLCESLPDKYPFKSVYFDEVGKWCFDTSFNIRDLL